MAGMRRLKVGLSIEPKTDRTLEALSYVTGRTKSELVTEGIGTVVANLPEAKKRAFDAVVAAAPRA